MGRKSESPGFRVTKTYLLTGVLFSLFLRWCVSSYPYSGHNEPPMYGDFEAQRHWQEITVHTPVVQWYQNTTQNDLMYWGLDYPPLTAYHSLLMGLVSDWLDPESVRLFASRGYEDGAHKVFMRFTVFLSDLYFFVPVVLCLCVDVERITSKENMHVFKRADVAAILFLLYPGIILIDHGHFQYNCVSLGLFMWATLFIVAIENDLLATMLFVLALNYKQMELYHALPFFFYLLRKCFIPVPHTSKIRSFVNKFNKIALTVICCFIIIYYPFANSINDVLQVVYRLFPLKRGVFEDKVANFWCFMNVFVKLKNRYSNEEMAKICLMWTATAALPSCLDLFVRFNKKKFILSLINVSLAFFLFSFQVHEKSILLVAIPVAMYFPEDPFMCFWFLLVSTFSMLPLLIRDGLLIPFISLNFIYIIAYSICLNLSKPGSANVSIFNAFKTYSIITNKKLSNSVYLNLLSLNFFFSFLGMVWLSLAIIFMKPLPAYPDLFALLISVYSCIHFVAFLLYFYYQQFRLPKYIPQKVKLN